MGEHGDSSFVPWEHAYVGCKNMIDIMKDSGRNFSDLDKIYVELRKISPNIEIKNDICFATSKRQDSLKEVTDEDVIFIIGDKISSNSTRLYEVAKKMYPHKDVYQISKINDLQSIDIKQYKKGFVSAGTSAPDNIINPIVDYLKNN